MEGRRVYLDAVVDELYGLAPGAFTGARDEHVKAARAAGDRDLAEAIRRLRRPTLAAWASNLLVRQRPDEVQRLLQLGEALRQAHQTLDGVQLRELSAQQHQVTFALARQAGRLAERAGQHISDEAVQEVQDTLRAVLADAEAAGQWAGGRLTKPLAAPAGFPGPSVGLPPAAAGRRTAQSDDKAADLDAARARRRERQERLERARQQAAEAEQALHERESELAAAQEEQRQTEEEEQQAGRRVTELSRQLEDAEREERRAREAAGKARDRLRGVDRVVREARRRARDAAVAARKAAEQAQRKA